LTASVTDPNDGNYYYVQLTYSTSTTEAKIIQQINSGGFNQGQIVISSPVNIDALGPAFTDGTSVLPNSISNPTGYFQSTATDGTTPTIILNSAVSNGKSGIEFQSNGTNVGKIFGKTSSGLVCDTGFQAVSFVGDGSNLSGIYKAVGSLTLTAGTGSVTQSGLTSGNHAFVTLLTPGGTLGVSYKAICTTNTLTITAVGPTGSTITTDTSTLNYIVF